MRKSFLPAVLGIVLIGTMGCGGGGGSETGNVTRELLAGTTEKTWKLTAIRGNETYTGGGVDVPCAASLRKTANTRIVFSCGASETITLRDSGTFNYRGVSGVSWVLSGNTVTLDAGSSGVLTGVFSVEPTAADAPNRLRVRLVNRVIDGVRNTDDDGCELIIEEQN